jgi:hypothetical protein
VPLRLCSSVAICACTHIRDAGSHKKISHRLELFAGSNNFFENLHYRQIRILPAEAF